MRKVGDEYLVRALIKSAVSTAISRSGAASVAGRWNARKLLVLGYHRVVQDFACEATYSIPSMLVTARMLERHLDWIGRRFRFATLDEVASRLESGEPFEYPTAAITFDDGYADVHENAFPMMRRKGIPGAVFVVTDLVETGQPQRHDALYLLMQRAFSAWQSPPKELAGILQDLRTGIDRETVLSSCRNTFQATSLVLDRLAQAQVQEVISSLRAIVDVDFDCFQGLRPLDWSMLGEMQKHGFTVGSHTRTHALLTYEHPASAAEQLSGSRRALESALGVPVTHLAYPDGRFSPEVVAAAIAAGYRNGYTICRHRDVRRPSMTIRRRVLWEKSCVDSNGRFSGDVMACQIAGTFDFIAPCTAPHESVPAARGTTSLPAYEHVENC